MPDGNSATTNGRGLPMGDRSFR